MSRLQTAKIMLTAAFLGFAASPSFAITFDAAADFSLSNNPNGAWNYGWSSTLGSAFNLLTETQDLCGTGTTDSWFNPNLFLGNPRIFQNQTDSAVPCGTFAFEPDKLLMHPGSSGQYSILRWIAPEAGVYSLATTFSGADYAGPTTTDVHILHNGSSLFSNLINGFGDPSASSFASTLSVLAGDTIDFAVGFGSNGSFWFDSTGLDATISSATQIPPENVPEPTSTLGLLGLAAAGVSSLLRRKQQKAQTSSLS